MDYEHTSAEVDKALRIGSVRSKKWNKFKNGYARLIILTIVSISAGLGMLIVPEKTSDWVIRGVGLIWTMEGISYALDVWKKYLESRWKI
jgi:uncharacterized membrane protein HdeD (DUF308 family)